MNRYIKNDRTIILAVIPCNVDIATQEILSIAKQVDPKGFRILGVLTKPDLIDKGGEESVMRLLEGKRNPLVLGYCIVRNRGQSELSSNQSARHAKEKEFFAAEPWSRLTKDRVGTPALQMRLQQLLITLTSRKFPKVQAQIVQRLSDCRKHLANLGPHRESTDQQRRFLLDISSQFQDLTNCALDAYYSRHTAFGNIPELRLATLAVARMERFAKDVETLGLTINFDLNEENEGSVSEDDSSEDEDDDSDDSDDDAVADQDATPLAKSAARMRLSPPLDSNILDWIGEEHGKSKGLGFGIGTIGPSILPTIWQAQSEKWEVISLNYISDIVFLIHDFIRKALIQVCPEEDIRSGLWLVLEEQLVEGYKAAIKHVNFVVGVERFGTPFTTNHYFNENLQKCKSLRLEKLLAKHAETPLGSRDKVVRLDQIKRSITMGNEHTVQDIDDILKSYYKVARKRFVDTVCMQGIDYHLLTGPKSPLRIFDTKFVSELSATQLESIAGEDMSGKQLRKNLEDEVDALERGKKLLRG